MKRVIVMGHGGYADGIRKNLDMIMGVPDFMYFVDLTKEDDFTDLEKKVDTLLEEFGEDQVLFVCDLLGASPFRAAAMRCAEHPEKYCTVTGLNIMALLEINTQVESELSIGELANIAAETAKMAISIFPEPA